MKIQKEKLLTILNWCRNGIATALVLVSILIFMTQLPIPHMPKLFVVTTSSMQPTIPAGSLVITQSQKEYQIGDIITRKAINNKNTITHRIIEKNQTADSVTFTTKGDGNNAIDYQQIVSNNIIGKVTFYIPLVGYLVSFAQSKVGLITLVIFPLVFLSIWELLSLWKSFRYFRKVRFRKDLLDEKRFYRRSFNPISTKLN